MRVLAALSGGVDSAVAAALAVEAGHEVTAVHMALSSEPQTCRVGSRGCCSEEDARDAARAAATLGIPFYVWDLSEEFEDRVVSDFLSEYRAGHTPNPCVRCNEFVKFKELLQRGLALGFDAICTGHYARILSGPDGPQLHRAADEQKDQSYVLAVMGQAELTQVLLPLGSAPSKAWVREQAEVRGLGVSSKPDSYDICFIPDGDTAGFLERKLGKQPGVIIDAEGNVVGQHEGYYRFTIGQRKGLGLGKPSKSGRPRYVLATEPSTNTVIVGESQLLSVDVIEGEDVVLLAPPETLRPDAQMSATFGSSMSGRALADVPDGVLTAQIRAHGMPSVVTSAVLSENGQGRSLEITLAEPIRGVAAGQSLVVYRGTRAVAEATIRSSRRRRDEGREVAETGQKATELQVV